MTTLLGQSGLSSHVGANLGLVLLATSLVRLLGTTLLLVGFLGSGGLGSLGGASGGGGGLALLDVLERHTNDSLSELGLGAILGLLTEIGLTLLVGLSPGLGPVDKHGLGLAQEEVLFLLGAKASQGTVLGDADAAMTREDELGGPSGHLSFDDHCEKIRLDKIQIHQSNLKAGRIQLVEYLVTALVPSETACLASSPGRRRRTAVWTSREERVCFLL